MFIHFYNRFTYLSIQLTKHKGGIYKRQLRLKQTTGQYNSIR